MDIDLPDIPFLASLCKELEIEVKERVVPKLDTRTTPHIPQSILEIIIAYVFTDVITFLLASHFIPYKDKEYIRIDDEALMKNPYAPPSYLEKKLDSSVKGSYASKNACISLEWIERNWRTYYSLLQYNRNIPESIFRESSSIIWEKVTSIPLEETDYLKNEPTNMNISDEFIMKNVHSYTREVLGMPWGGISGGRIPRDVVVRYYIPEAILREWKDFIPWEQYCTSRCVSVNVLRYLIEEDKTRDEEKKYLTKGSWTKLSSNRSVPIEFLLENEENIDIYWFIPRHRVPLEFIRRKKISNLDAIMEKNPLLPIEVCLDYLDRDGDRTRYLFVMRVICANFHVTYEILKETCDILLPSRMPNFSKGNGDILRGDDLPNWQKSDIRACWKALADNPHTPMRFLEENSDLIDWERLSSNPSIPVSMIKKNLKLVDWKNLSANSGFWRRQAEEELREKLMEIF